DDWSAYLRPHSHSTTPSMVLTRDRSLGRTGLPLRSTVALRYRAAWTWVPKLLWSPPASVFDASVSMNSPCALPHIGQSPASCTMNRPQAWSTPAMVAELGG